MTLPLSRGAGVRAVLDVARGSLYGVDSSSDLLQLSVRCPGCTLQDVVVDGEWWVEVVRHPLPCSGELSSVELLLPPCLSLSLPQLVVPLHPLLPCVLSACPLSLSSFLVLLPCLCVQFRGRRRAPYLSTPRHDFRCTRDVAEARLLTRGVDV